jgi:hypothetical protein
MAGHKLFNFPAFDAAARELRRIGFEVRSPAEHARDLGLDERLETLEGFDLGAARAWNLEQVRNCHVLCTLPGWERSPGALEEFDLAISLHKPILTGEFLFTVHEPRPSA